MATLRRIAILGSFALTALFAHAQATWYLQDDMAKNTSWRSPSKWNSAADGSGTPATAINATDTYDTNGRYVRANGSFAGGKLLQSGGRIDMKRASQTIEGDWEVTGDTATLHQGVRTNASYLFTVNGRLILTGPLRVLHTTDGMRGIDLTIGTLTGPGDLIIGSGKIARDTTVSLGLMKVENHTGSIIVETGSTLLFANDQQWTGPLEVATGAHLKLNKAITVPAATLGSQPLEAGTYTVAQLREKHPDIVAEDATGTLTVAP